MYFMSIATLFLMSFNLQSSSDVHCSFFRTECLQLRSSSLYTFFQFVQPLKVLQFHSFVKEATLIYLSSSSSFSLRCHPRSWDEILSQWWSVVTPRDHCARCPPVIRCHYNVIRLCCILSCHHVHCIIMFSKLAFAHVSPFSPLFVLSPTTLARTRGMFEISFYKWTENVLGIG